MTDPDPRDTSGEPERPDAQAPPAPAVPEAPSSRYRATLRLIRSRLVDEARSQRKAWWKSKS